MPKRVEVVHAASPVCHWSWGYEPVISRLEAVYGKQVKFTITVGVPYTSREKWLEDYGMTDAEAVEFTKEIRDAGGLPFLVPRSFHDLPATCLPQALAVKAAGLLHGPRAERRLARALMYAAFVEAKDTSDEGVLAAVVNSLGLDLPGMLKAAQGEDAMNALAEDHHRGGHGLNFYSLLVRDEAGTSITLEQAYDPARVEAAIDWLAGRKLKKSKPRDVLAYVEENGPVSAQEIARAFAVPAAKARAALAKEVKRGRLERFDVKAVEGGRFWRVAR